MLAHWNNSPLVDMSLLSETLFWFRAKMSLFLFLNAVCLAEKQQIPILVFGLIWPGLEPTIYHIRGEHGNCCTTDVIGLFDEVVFLHIS